MRQDIEHLTSGSQSIEAILNSSGVNVSRVENLSSIDDSTNSIRATVTVCPLYAPGTLNESQLLIAPNSLEVSRVHIKWATGVHSLRTINRELQRAGVSFDVQFTFADMGVIRNAPTSVDENALVLHRSLYENAAERDLASHGINWRMTSYSEMGFDFPQFISAPESTESSDDNAVANQIGHELGQVLPFDPSVLNTETGTFNKSGRRIVTSMISAVGPELTKGLLTQYGTFDNTTSQSDTMNLYYERSTLLLNVTNLFTHKHRPRIDILCK